MQFVGIVAVHFALLDHLSYHLTALCICSNAQVDTCDPYGATTLHVAALYGHEGCMKCVFTNVSISWGPNFSSKIDFFCYIRALLAAHADINRTDNDGGTGPSQGCLCWARGGMCCVVDCHVVLCFFSLLSLCLYWCFCLSLVRSHLVGGESKN